MNILYRGCGSKEGYQSNILKKVYDKGLFEHCTIITQTMDGKDVYPDDVYHEISAEIGYQTAYSKVCNIEELPALSEELLRAMLPYKSVAFNMSCRNFHLHIYNYYEMEEEYLQHITYWNHILDEDKIDMVFLSTTPHHMWEYIIYALAKVRGIPVLIETIANIPGLNEVATSLENIGNNAYWYYLEHPDLELEGDMRRYYEKIKFEKEYLPKRRRAEIRKETRKWAYNTFHKGPYLRVINIKPLIKDIIRFDFDKFFRDFQSYLKNLNNVRRIIVAKSHLKGWKYYDKKLTQPVSLKEKYIYYALQYFPEASVLPRGGVFENQILAIKILAQAAKEKGIKVYVKEHWIEESRTKRFYNELANIPNVYMLPLETDTYELIDGAVAVASQTGSCLTEAIIRGVPSLAFAQSCICGAPGVFRVGAVEEVLHVLQIIDNEEYSIDEKALEHYFAALDKTLVKGYLEWTDDSKRRYNLTICIDETVGLVEKFVKTGMSEDFLYFNETKIESESPICANYV